ncbi:hypothetical protein UFOVP1413_15 [uncultured Caudovirales phage]|uniref:NAT_SF domain containing protein n=1 Tax=uncultured Caudovirales phage TaxID=2100421 RepID=A0A6J5PIH0_9CAUD|nr:hypothetical protein UFOVP893_24 [uncultured Caudovirales phage]CAB4210399.1 hypothetical protein UFOVP1413_15 [uncultured Caudovirales phage]
MVMRARATREKTVRSRSLRSTDLFVASCELGDVKAFIETHHYSHSVFGVTASRCFSVTYQDELAGGAIFGLPAGVGVAAKYADGGNLLELRRFALRDKAPRNSESRALGVMFRTLRREGYTRILSYADPMHGHSGVIYKATGFEYRGRTAARKHIMWKGKKYPDRNVHQVNFPYHLELRAALASGEAAQVRIEPKHIYVKKL